MSGAPLRTSRAAVRSERTIEARAPMLISLELAHRKTPHIPIWGMGGAADVRSKLQQLGEAAPSEGHLLDGSRSPIRSQLNFFHLPETRQQFREGLTRSDRHDRQSIRMKVFFCSR